MIIFWREPPFFEVDRVSLRDKPEGPKQMLFIERENRSFLRN